jgi:preprotein translocase subunit SecE
MSIIKAEDNRKWTSAFLVACCFVITFATIKFLGQMSDWFELEAKVSNFTLVKQGLGIIVGAGVFFAVLYSKKATSYLDEVYSELLKVVWPDRESVVKLTIGIVIALIIVSSIFLGVDFIFSKLLGMVY